MKVAVLQGNFNASESLTRPKDFHDFLMSPPLNVMGASYVPGGPLVLDLEAFDKYRDFFHQFGLGVNTGIDLPRESIGFIESSRTSGKL